jgi:hypothetical protein
MVIVARRAESVLSTRKDSVKDEDSWITRLVAIFIICGLIYGGYEAVAHPNRPDPCEYSTGKFGC